MSARPGNRSQHRPRQRGFSMLEVMVTLVVLSIGLLGLAGLMTVGVKYSHQSLMRTQATMLLGDMADRMRANPQGVQAGNYDVGAAMPNSYPGCVNGSTGAFTPGTACTPAQMAQYDLYAWSNEIKNALPGGAGQIQTVAGNGALQQITVTWQQGNNQQLSQTVQVQVLQ